MKKERQVGSYQRKTKSGKVITVSSYKAGYKAKDGGNSPLKKKGAGKELEALKKPWHGLSRKEFEAWYHRNPGEELGDKAENILIEKMGEEAYREFSKQIDKSYNLNGADKAWKEITRSKPKKVTEADTTERINIPGTRLWRADDPNKPKGRYISITGEGALKPGEFDRGQALKSKELTDRAEQSFQKIDKLVAQGKGHLIPKMDMKQYEMNGGRKRERALPTQKPKRYPAEEVFKKLDALIDKGHTDFSKVPKRTMELYKKAGGRNRKGASPVKRNQEEKKGFLSKLKGLF